MHASLTLIVLFALGDSPGPTELKPDERIVFFPTCGQFDESAGQWVVPIHAVVFEPEADSTRRRLLVSGIRRALRVEEGSDEARVLDRRLRHFLVDPERGKAVAVRVGGQVRQVGVSNSDGHVRGVIRLTQDEGETPSADRWIDFEAALAEGDARTFAGRALLLAPEGLSCVSDIDDTIKLSQVTQRSELLRNTFLRAFRPAPGMAEWYGKLAERGAAFHYVSGSPWQIFEPLDEFLKAEGFPPGTFHLKRFDLGSPRSLAALGDQRELKLSAIGGLLAAFPRRTFLLVGDSGEQDPEIYGELARKHPRQVVGVFIRNVTDERPDSPRFERAMKGVEPDRWRLFGRPEEVAAAMSPDPCP